MAIKLGGGHPASSFYTFGNRYSCPILKLPRLPPQFNSLMFTEHVAAHAKISG